MVNDPIADLLTRLRNAQAVNKESVVLGYSKLKEAIANLLAKEGFVKEVSKKKKNNTFEILLFSKNAEKSILGAVRASKPSRRFYVKADSIRPFKNGYGMAIISTSKGLMTDKQAMKEKVGGEVLFKIW
ncbi:MAG: 30S ribosomal protein S8 [bacterium]